MFKNIKKSLAVFCLFFLLSAGNITLSAAALTDYFTLGDVDNDYAVTSSDARLALRYSVGLEKEEALHSAFGSDYALRKAMDVDRDSEISSADARLILRMSVGLSDEQGEAYSYSQENADAVCKKYGAVNVQAAVLENGKIIATYTYGYADKSKKTPVTDSGKIRVASLSKLLTFSVCMALCDAGVLDLDADISKYMGFTVRNPSYPEDAITLRMLMTHTASIRDGTSFNTSLSNSSATAMKTLLTGSSNYYSWIRPGSVTVYSNFGAAIVGSVCEMVTQKRFSELADTYIIDPLGMDAAYVAADLADPVFLNLYSGGYLSWSADSYKKAAFHTTLGQTCHLVQGNLLCSASDYAKLMALLLNGGRTQDGKQLLTQKSVNEMLKIQFADNNESIGFGTYILDTLFDGIHSYTHTGSAYGFYGAYAMDKEYKNGVVVLTSGGSYSIDSNTQIYSICKELICELMPSF